MYVLWCSTSMHCDLLILLELQAFFSSSWERIGEVDRAPFFWNWYIGQCHTVVDFFSILQVAWIALSPSGQSTKSGKNFSGNMNSASWLPSAVFIEMKHILVCFTDSPFELGITGIFFIIKKFLSYTDGIQCWGSRGHQDFPWTTFKVSEMIYFCFAVEQNISTGPDLKDGCAKNSWNLYIISLSSLVWGCRIG